MIPTVTADTPIEPVDLPKPVDVSNVHHAWLSPQGEWHEVGYEGHDYYAGTVLKMRQNVLYAQGWIKLSGNEWYDEDCGWRKRVTQAQLNEIERWYRSGATGRSFNPEDFETR